MKKGIKICTIGGGSSYTPELIEGFIKRYNELPVKEIWLVDIKAGEEKLNIVGALAKRMVEKAGVPTKINITLNRQEALKDADFVTTQLRVGLLDARIKDERIPLKFGVLGQETTGPGGLFNGLRTIPVLLDICKDMEKLCPNAWLINFTNPVGMVTEATRIPVKTIDMVSTPMVLEATRKTLLDSTLEDVYNSCINLSPFVGRIYKDSFKFETDIKKDVIITACLTGQGAALKLKNILNQKLNLQSKGIDVIPLDIDDKIEFNNNIQNIKREKNLIGVVGALKPEDDSILYLSTYEIFLPENMDYLCKTIDTLNIIENMNAVIKENVSIDSNRFIESFKLFYLRLLNNQIILDGKNSVGLILHMSCLVERLLKGEMLINKNSNENFYRKYMHEVSAIKDCLKPIEELFNIDVPKSEIVYITKAIYLI